MGRLWSTPLDHSPFDVVAWRGNYAPYKYDLRRFNTIGSVSYDHPDPSIFLVLQSVTDTAGVDSIDFVIFPPRWLAMQETFSATVVSPQRRQRVHGAHSRRLRCQERWLCAGRRLAAQLHERTRSRCRNLRKASRADTRAPEQLVDTMAFMFETRWVIQPTRAALDSATAARLLAMLAGAQEKL